MAEHKAAAALTLPVAVIGPIDVGRLIRELQAIDETALQAGLRQGEVPAAKLPKTSQLMDQTASANKLDLMKKTDRDRLKRYLEEVKAKAPVLHVSLSADPPPIFLEKLTSWFRREIHPSALLTVGLQPNIGAGCILRTTNKQFDFSLRQDFAGKRDLLLQKIAGSPSAEQKAAPAGAAVSSDAVEQAS